MNENRRDSSESAANINLNFVRYEDQDDLVRKRADDICYPILWTGIILCSDNDQKTATEETTATSFG